ncbi:MAG: type II toxin-antitoxin system VapC family toxin [Chloroflexota bacterium]|nr:type II toxin-antitoxin system VapC family toxin [Chloroflexota bacterium]
MIFLDVNVFLRYLAPSSSPATIVMKEVAQGLFASVRRGELEATTSEVVIHEVCYVLQSASHYRMETASVVEYLQPLIAMSGMIFPGADKRIYLRALDLLLNHPKLEFSDAVIAARAEWQGVPLATFDEYLAGMPFVTRWVPSSRSTE